MTLDPPKFLMRLACLVTALEQRRGVHDVAERERPWTPFELSHDGNFNRQVRQAVLEPSVRLRRVLRRRCLGTRHGACDVTTKRGGQPNGARPGVNSVRGFDELTRPDNYGCDEGA